ncbi:hypothetical protein HYH02_000228 [Chlamydomonas schloesseri]|uniref:Leucine-rich repeat-containing protein 51 n=1 Tax=Chlamydomonas schloesseri TaxID=2026947 RepID=A0A836B7W1_9CHLO|nr:hypothetical protein HYH02_000228 [Chlamydomonas schloesseri]|eukprot:KAG2450125.1 hypothetical protein HYH02_000228 [Chlamydomonas schloesseri]
MPVEAEASSSPSRIKAAWLTQTLQDQKQLAAGPPIDYSFKDLKTVLDLVLVEPNSGQPRKPALPPDSNTLEYLESLAAADQAAAESEVLGEDSPRRAGAAAPLAPMSPGASPSGRGGGGGGLGAKLNSNSIRLCNNHLMSLNGLGRVVRHCLDDWRQLVWLDVSSNQLTTIEDTILEFPSLQVLYLHGNAITNMNDVLKLQQLPRLTKLTLHGNPISEQKNYKMWVVAHLSVLRSFDFGPITKIERDKIDTWFKGLKKKH